MTRVSLADRMAADGITAAVKAGAPAHPTFAESDGWTVTLTRADGRSMVTPFYTGRGWRDTQPAGPTAADVLGALLSDAGTVESEPDFDGWAESLGYNSDSREAERIYLAVVA